MTRLAPPPIPDPKQSPSAAHDTANTIIFQFTDEEVANADFSRFLCLWGISSGRRPGISKLRGNLCVAFPDDGKSSVTYLCERNRSFCQKFFSEFPYWGFFFSLRSMALWNLTMALVANARIFEFEGAPRLRIVFADDELSRIVDELVRNAQSVGRLAGLNPEQNNVMVAEIRDYFARLVTSHAQP